MRIVTGRVPIWPLATVSLAASVSTELLLKVFDPDRASTHHSAWHLLVGAVGGAMAGWFVLRARFQRAWWWLWAMAVLALVSVASNSLDISGFAEQLSGLLQTVGYVVLSGLALWEISKNPLPDPLPDRTVMAQVLGLALLTMAASIAIR